jgi:hypothetical protein
MSYFTASEMIFPCILLSTGVSFKFPITCSGVNWCQGRYQVAKGNIKTSGHDVAYEYYGCPRVQLVSFKNNFKYKL